MRPGGAPRRFAATAKPLLLVLAAGFAAILAAGCSTTPAGLGGEVSGSGTPATKQYDYRGFNRLRVDNAFAATVTRGDAFAVTVTVDDNLVKHPRVELDGDTLAQVNHAGG